MGRLWDGSVLTKQQIERLKKWAMFKQDQGFHGRTNKPDDSCYAFWIGGTLKVCGFILFTSNLSALDAQQRFVGGPYGPAGFPNVHAGRSYRRLQQVFRFNFRHASRAYIKCSLSSFRRLAHILQHRCALDFQRTDSSTDLRSTERSLPSLRSLATTPITLDMNASHCYGISLLSLLYSTDLHQRLCIAYRYGL